MKTFRIAILVLLAGTLLVSAPGMASPQEKRDAAEGGMGFGPPHVNGMRATLVDITGLDVTINVTEGYVTNQAWTFSTAWIGVASTFGAAPLFPAVDWGDGSTIPWAGYGPSVGIPVSAYNVTLAGQPAHVYVGTFTHTYGTADDFTVTVNSINGVGSTAGQAPPIGTGVLTGQATPTFGNVYYFVQNTLQIPLGGPDASDTIEIDTVSDLGLLILALVLGLSAVMMLRR